MRTHASQVQMVHGDYTSVVQVFAECFDQEELITEINGLIEESSNHNSMLIECRKLIALLNQ